MLLISAGQSLAPTPTSSSTPIKTTIGRSTITLPNAQPHQPAAVVALVRNDDDTDTDANGNENGNSFVKDDERNTSRYPMLSSSLSTTYVDAPPAPQPTLNGDAADVSTSTTGRQPTVLVSTSSASVEDHYHQTPSEMVLTERVGNFDAVSTAPALNEQTLGGDFDQQVGNGLFRIKIAEIITDEFDNSLMASSSNNNNNMNNDNALGDTAAAAAAFDSDQQRRMAAAYGDGRADNIKLADLYPSKLEDFGPVIRRSNERLINDKHVFVPEESLLDDGDDEALRGHVLLNSYEPETAAVSLRVPTTKIEIELIDDVDETAASSASKVSDFQRELLRDNDGIINTIERSFVHLTPLKRGDAEKFIAIGNINKAPYKGGFIERRVKKLDLKVGRGAEVAKDLPSHEEHPSPVAKTDDDEEHSTKVKPEFSTTKFYNSKETYSELMHKRQEVDITTVAAHPATVEASKLTTEMPTSSDNGKTSKSLDKLQKMSKKIANMSKGLPSIAKSKSLKSIKSESVPTISNAPNVGSNVVTPTTASSVDDTSSSTERPTNNPSTAPVSENQQTNIHTDIIDDRSIMTTTTLSTPTADGAISTVISSTITSTTTTSTTSTPPTDEPSTEISTTIGALSTVTTAIVDPTTIATATAATATVSSGTTMHASSANPIRRPTINVRKTMSVAASLHALSSTSLSRLQERLNALDCEMPGELEAIDVNVWRGNETHELNLPFTVSGAFWAVFWILRRIFCANDSRCGECELVCDLSFV